MTRLLVVLLDCLAIGLILRATFLGEWHLFGAAGALIIAAEIVREGRLTR
jgi:hypothetical protein